MQKKSTLGDEIKLSDWIIDTTEVMKLSNLISYALSSIHVVIFTLISILVQDYIYIFKREEYFY